MQSPVSILLVAVHGVGAALVPVTGTDQVPNPCVSSAVAARLRDRVEELVTSRALDEQARAREYGLRSGPATAVKIAVEPSLCRRAILALGERGSARTVAAVVVVSAGSRYVVLDTSRLDRREWLSA